LQGLSIRKKAADEFGEEKIGRGIIFGSSLFGVGKYPDSVVLVDKLMVIFLGALPPPPRSLTRYGLADGQGAKTKQNTIMLNISKGCHNDRNIC
jgi:hypothetical protein